MDTRTASRQPQHETGDFGERFVAYHLPSAWVVHSYKGNEDYGSDFHVEVFAQGRPTGLEFGVQVKATNNAISRESAFVSLTKNNLAYIAAKPYPTMAVLVSRPHEFAIYGWIQEMVSDDQLARLLDDPDAHSKRIPLTPCYDFRGGECSMIDFLNRRRHQLESWLATTAHTHLLVNIYLDIHAALDALIECVSVIHRNDRTDDEVSHKATFTFTLGMMSYGCLYWITLPERVAVLGPIAPTMIALRGQYRSMLSLMVPEEYLLDYERGGSDENPIAILPANTSRFFPSVPRLACVVRDVLRTIGSLMSPSRDFSLRMSGLATDIIEYNSRNARSSDGGQRESDNQRMDQSGG